MTGGFDISIIVFVVTYGLFYEKGVMFMETKNVGKLVDLILRAIAVGMAVAAVVLNVLATVPAETQILMLGIGVFCLAIIALDAKG
jgi:TRAP-type uncharacterized transport system fused permease subunit